MTSSKASSTQKTLDTSSPQHAKKLGWVRLLIAFIIVFAGIGVAGVGGPYFGKISEVTTNSQTDFLPQSAESTRVVSEQRKFFGDDTVPAIVVFTSDAELTEEQNNYLVGLSSRLRDGGVIEGETSPVIYSEDRKAAEIIIPLDASQKTSDSVQKLRDFIQNAPLESYVTGPAGLSADLVKAFGAIDGILLLVAVVAVFIILLIVYRSPLLPILVLLTSMVALSASIFAVWHLADAGIVKINGQVQGILLILVVGAATDYSILYVARYREALILQKNRFSATLTAWKGSFEPILASGLTVIAGMLCLLLSQLESNKALGPVAASGISLSMVTALTFLPALLALFGRVAFWPARPRFNPDTAHAETSSKFWTRVADFVVVKPRKVWALTAVGLLVAAGFSMTLKADGLPQSEFVLGQSEARDGQKALAEHFPGGSGSPANILVAEDQLDSAVSLLEGADGVAEIVAVAQDSPSSTIPVGEAGADLPPAFANIEPTVVDGEVLLQATLSDPADSDEAQNTVKELRQDFADAGIPAVVGGSSATSLDTNESSLHDLRVIIPTVLVVIALILMVLLRSILAPLLLIACTVISYLSALGVSALLFNHVFHFPGADPSVPLYGFVFLVALGIDYTIFLMTRVREETLELGTHAGMRKGLIVTGGVITSAGVVLAATFAALAVIPLIFLFQLAFIVAFGVLLDATIVRALLIPALVEDIGKKIWWPSKLATSAD